MINTIKEWFIDKYNKGRAEAAYRNLVNLEQRGKWISPFFSGSEIAYQREFKEWSAKVKEAKEVYEKYKQYLPN